MGWVFIGWVGGSLLRLRGVEPALAATDDLDAPINGVSGDSRAFALRSRRSDRHAFQAAASMQTASFSGESAGERVR